MHRASPPVRLCDLRAHRLSLLEHERPPLLLRNLAFADQGRILDEHSIAAQRLEVEMPPRAARGFRVINWT